MNMDLLFSKMMNTNMINRSITWSCRKQKLEQLFFDSIGHSFQ